MGQQSELSILVILIGNLVGFIFTTYLLVGNLTDLFATFLLGAFDAVFICGFFLMIYLYFKSDREPIETAKMDRREWRFSVAVVGTFILLLASIGMIIVMGLGIVRLASSFQLALILIFGVMTLLSSLVIASVVLRVLDLHNPNEALGLPPGSVRAIIALMLILIFAIMSIFMYQYLNQPSETVTVTHIENVTDSVSGNYTFTNSTTTTITGASEAMVDFSKQTLTTLSTLVVALAAFYFGTRSVAQAQQAKRTAQVTITPASPYKLKLDENQGIDSIRVTTVPENEQIEFSVENDQGGKIIRSDEPNVFRYEPSTATKTTPNTKKVILRFWMTKYPEDKEELEVDIIPAKQKTVPQQIAEARKELDKLEEEKKELEKEKKEIKKNLAKPDEE